MGYDSNTEETYIQLEEFPYFAFLRNGNLKALSSHNQTMETCGHICFTGIFRRAILMNW